MKKNWTPGPWRHVSDNGWDAVRPEAHPMLICKLAENNPENATLIAAAPDLYEALELIATRPNCEMTDIDFKNWARMIAKSALKKAQGAKE